MQALLLAAALALVPPDDWTDARVSRAELNTRIINERPVNQQLIWWERWPDGVWRVRDYHWMYGQYHKLEAWRLPDGCWLLGMTRGEQTRLVRVRDFWCTRTVHDPEWKDRCERPPSFRREPLFPKDTR